MTTKQTATKALHTFTLPWPPSVNQYYRAVVRGSGKRAYASNILSKPGREYKQACRAAIGFVAEKAPGCLAVSIKLCPPTRRAFDVDNRAKAILDALTECGVWNDDSQVERLTLIKGPRITGGRAEVTVEVLG